MDQTLAATMRILSGGVANIDEVERAFWADPRLIEELVWLWHCPIREAQPSTTFRPSAAEYDAT